MGKIKSSKNIIPKLAKTALFVLLFLILIAGAKKGFEFGEDLFSEKGSEERPGNDVEVVIDSGDGKLDVAEKMVDAGLAKSKWVFFTQSLLYSGKFSAGTYTVNTSESPEKLIHTLSEKPTAQSTPETEKKTVEQQTTEQQTME